MRRLHLILASLAIALGISGCGSDRPETATVTGTVTYKGAPLPDADVNFLPATGRPATGRTDANGKFQLMTFEQGDGALIGQHVVTVKKEVSKDPKATGPYITYVSVIPKHYGDQTKSPLKADVTAGGPNDFTFDVTSDK